MPTALITGANRGIGRALASEFAQRGWRIIATVRTKEAVQSLRALGDPKHEVHMMDVADRGQVEAVAQALTGVPIDALIANAALTGGPIGTFGSFSHARFAEACRVNVGGFVNLCECFADQVAASARRVIFAMSSRVGANPFYGYAEYFASKSALNQMVLQYSVALRERGITVVAAHPGWVETEATAAQGQAPLSSEDAAKLLADIIESLHLPDSGRFFDPDRSELPLVTRATEIKFYSKARDATR